MTAAADHPESLTIQHILASVRRVQYHTRRAVQEFAPGAYRSVFKGHGIEFEDVREFTPGDDARDIDWRVTARLNRPVVKRYVEDRDMTLLLLVDISASMDATGLPQPSPREAAAELAAILAFSANQNGDRVGLHLFTGEAELRLAPRKGRRHALRIIREVLFRERVNQQTDMAGAIRRAIRLAGRGTSVVIISDCLAPDFALELDMLAARHDVILIELRPPATAIPSGVLMHLRDPESGHLAWVRRVSPADPRKTPETWSGQSATGPAGLRSRKRHVDRVVLLCDEDPAAHLRQLFSARRKLTVSGRRERP